MRIAIGSDHGGVELKDGLAAFLKAEGFDVKDFGTYSTESCDYPKVAFRLSKAVAQGKFDRGVLICKSGIGNSIVANKVKGIRAALCYNLTAAKLSRQHNNANVLVLGSLFVDIKKAKNILKVWLKTDFEGGRHQRRVKQIERIEKNV